MRHQVMEGEKQNEAKYCQLRDEMLGRKKAFEESVADYKQSLIRAKEKKKQIQSDNSSYWKQQMGWRQEKKDELKKEEEQYDPELVWNIEGPTRRKNDMAKRQSDNEWTRKTLDEQTSNLRLRKTQERFNDLSEGKKLIQNDLEAADLERSLIAFKKQLFAQEMLSTWEKQNRYRKNMKVIGDEI